MLERTVCLGFADPWSLCTTTPFSFSDLQTRRTYEALTLESLRDLTMRRAQGCQKQAKTFREQLEWCGGSLLAHSGTQQLPQVL